MKRLFGALLLCLYVFPISLAFAQYEIGAYEYAASSDKEIPVRFSFEDTLRIDTGAFRGTVLPDHLTRIILPDGFKELGTHAFERSNLAAIEIPDSIEIIGDNPFLGCKNLTQIKVSPTHPWLAVIDGVLYNKTNKSIIYAPVQTTSFVIPEGIRAVEAEAFSCTALSSITIPESVESIGASAFANTKITSIAIPDSVVSIGDHAFSGSCITEASLPGGITEIPSGLFSLTSMTSFTIPEGVTKIGSFAFADSGLTSIHIPESVTEIDVSCFEGTPMTSIALPSGLKTVSIWMFKDSGLTSIDIPHGVTIIDSDAFRNAPLTSVTIPDTVEEIGKRAFAGAKLTSVTIPESVKLIGDYAFRDVELIKGAPGSAAEDYAFQHGVAFEPTSSVDNAEPDFSWLAH